MKKSIVLFIVMIVLVGFLFAAGQSESKGPVVLKLGHGAQASHPLQLTSEKFASIVKEKTEGRVDIQVFLIRNLVKRETWLKDYS